MNQEVDRWHMWSMDMSPVYLFSDSQGGRNLLNSEYHMVLAQDFFKLHQVFCAIQQTLRALGDDSLTDDELKKGFLEGHGTLVATGEKLIKHHANIPVVLGSGHATLIHEFVALQHAVFMETGCSSTLAIWNQCVASTAADRGVEKGLNKVGPLSLAKLSRIFWAARNQRNLQETWTLTAKWMLVGLLGLPSEGKEAVPNRMTPCTPMPVSKVV